MKKDKMIRSDEEFRRMIKEIKETRFKTGKDKSFLSSARITKAIARVPKLKDILVDAELK